MKSVVFLAALAAFSFPMSSQAQSKTESIVLGGGCFWCLDAAYKLLPGIVHVTCGYAGGKTQNPTYEQVSSGDTGHAEVVKIDYDPRQIPLDQVLDFFWHVHNPTQVGGQGNDFGPQYRSIILFSDEGQQIAAEASRAKAQSRFQKPITTEIVRLEHFWQAEDYHQDYFEKHPDQGYCQFVIAPKIEHLREELHQK